MTCQRHKGDVFALTRVSEAGARRFYKTGSRLSSRS